MSINVLFTVAVHVPKTCAPEPRPAMEPGQWDDGETARLAREIPYHPHGGEHRQRGDERHASVGIGILMESPLSSMAIACLSHEEHGEIDRDAR